MLPVSPKRSTVFPCSSIILNVNWNGYLCHHIREERRPQPSWKKASSFLLQPSLTPKLFETLATRYADRPGGYTRIHKFGHRPGDNAPHAVLELVDGPRDLKFEMAARATGWDVYFSSRLVDTRSSPRALVEGGVKDVEETVERERKLALGEAEAEAEDEGELRERTRWNLRKALRYRSSEDVKRFGDKVQEHMVRLCCNSPGARTRVRTPTKGNGASPHLNQSSH